MPITLDGTNGITTPDLESSGPVIGTTGTFSGAVTGNGLTTPLYPLVSGTAVASTSGTAIDFTGIPSWAKRITVGFVGVSTSGTVGLHIQLGTSGGFEVTGYESFAFQYNSGGAAGSTSGLITSQGGTAAQTHRGFVTLVNINANNWASSGVIISAGGNVTPSAGNKTLGGTLDRIRIAATNGTDTFDAGTINIMWE